MGEGKVESHNMGPTFYRLTSLSFHVHRPSHSWYDFFKIWPWKSKVMVVGERNVESNKVGVAYYGLTSLSFHVNRPFHSWDTAFSKFQLENPRSRSNDHDVAQLQDQTRPWNLKWCKSIQQFQRYAFRKVWTQFVANLSSFWPMGKPIWCKWANDHGSAQLTLQAETIPQNFECRKSVKRLQRYGFR